MQELDHISLRPSSPPSRSRARQGYTKQAETALQAALRCHSCMHFCMKKWYSKQQILWDSEHQLSHLWVLLLLWVCVRFCSHGSCILFRCTFTGQPWRWGQLRYSPRSAPLPVTNCTEYALTPMGNSFSHKQKLTSLFSKITLTARFQNWTIVVISPISLK